MCRSFKRILQVSFLLAMTVLYGCGNGFSEVPPAPDIETSVATEVTQVSSTLNATVVPYGTEVKVWFEWSTDDSFNSKSEPVLYGGGGAKLLATYRLDAMLVPNTRYYFRAVAQNDTAIIYGPDSTFKTDNIPLPVSTTVQPNVITDKSCTLTGKINPGGFPTSAWFEWGETANNYNSTTPIQDVGDGVVDIVVVETISGLSSQTTYHYRIVSENEGGVAFGDDMMCMTLLGTAPGTARPRRRTQSPPPLLRRSHRYTPPEAPSQRRVPSQTTSRAATGHGRGQENTGRARG